MNEEFIMGILQGMMYEIPPFEKYCTHTFQNNYMPVVGESQSKVLPFARLRNKLFLPEDDTKKDKSDMIGEMDVTAAKALLADIQDEKKGYGGAYVKCWGHFLLV